MTSAITRRAAFGRFVGAGALAIPAAALASIPADPDAEIIALSVEIVRRTDEAAAIQETHIDPFQERFFEILNDRSKSREVACKEAFAFSRECGRTHAIGVLDDFDSATTRLFERLVAIPAATQPGRAAKVRALICHGIGNAWRGPAIKLDPRDRMARDVLGQLAGMSAEDLAAI
jgi:hypothetical protein